MNQPRRKTPGTSRDRKPAREPGPGRKYLDIADMVRQVAEDPEFAQDFENLLARRQILTDLVALRAAAGLSQRAIAAELKCTQSRVSKLEAGSDAELRLGDLADYAGALGYETRIVLFKNASDSWGSA